VRYLFSSGVQLGMCGLSQWIKNRTAARVCVALINDQSTTLSSFQDRFLVDASPSFLPSPYLIKNRK
jgi:hypothetical protein